MKTKILSIIALTLAVCGLQSCSEDWNPKTEKTGQVSLKSMGVEVAGAEKVMSGRAEVDLNPFLVKIYTKDEDRLVQQWTYAEMPEIFTLPVGDYRVDVCSHEVKKAAWDEPLYKGSQEFTIENSKITAVDKIQCKFSSLKVTVKYDDELTAACGQDVKVTVFTNDEGRLEYSLNESRAGFFEVVEGSTTLTAHFDGNVNGYTEHIHQVYNGIEAGQHYIITFSLKQNTIEPDPETGSIDPANGINVDVNVAHEDLTSSGVKPEEDPIAPNGGNPNEEHFKEKVNITSDLAFDTELDPAAIAAANVNVSAPAGIASFSVAFASDNADCTAAINLAALGIPAQAEAAGKTELTFSLAQLAAKCADYVGLHTVTIKVTDTANNSLEKAIKLRVKEEEPIEFISNLRFNTPMNPSDEPDGKVQIVTKEPIKKFLVGVSSTNEDFAAVAGVLDGVDLCNPGDKAGTLTGFGLANGADVLDQHEVLFDITMFMGPAFLPAFPGTHTFTLTVTDASGFTSERVLIFEVK